MIVLVQPHRFSVYQIAEIGGTYRVLDAAHCERSAHTTRAEAEEAMREYEVDDAKRIDQSRG